MSNAMAIAAITAVLKQLVDDATFELATDMGGTFNVTALPPDQVIKEGGEGPAINLFMYQVSQNPGWANADLPERDSRGRRISNPPLALDLHYMLTAVGAKDFHCDILLGHAMQVMHDYPVLARSLIDEKLRNAGSTGSLSSMLQTLARSGLSEQVEQIKLSPEYLSRDEISTIWSSMQTPYRPSAYYQASVVLLQNQRPVRTPLPVRSVSSHVVPIRRPQIDAIIPAAGADAPIEAGETLDVRGRRLSADHVSLRIDSTLYPVDASNVGTNNVADDQITFDLPADLSPGPHVLQVVHQLEFTDPDTQQVVGEPRPIFESNTMPFSLRPSFSSVAGSPRVIRLDLTSPVQPGQRIFMTLQPQDPASAEAVSFAVEVPASTGTAQPQSVLYAAVSGLDPNLAYIVRLQVDGVENLIEFDSVQQEFSGPEVQPNLDELIVDSLAVTLQNQQAKVDVEIHNQDGAKVKGAEVELRFSGPDTNLPHTETKTTGQNGKVTFNNLPASDPGVYTAEVVDVTKTGSILNALQGVLTATGEK
jgi:hypothetical protein